MDDRGGPIAGRTPASSERAILYLLSPILYLLPVMVGCSDSSATTRPTAADRALSDPWNYGMSPAKPDTEPKKGDPSFDRDGLKKDLNNVFNP